MEGSIVDILSGFDVEELVVFYTICRFTLECLRFGVLAYPSYKHIHKLIVAAQYLEDPERRFNLQPLESRLFRFVIGRWGPISSQVLNAIRRLRVCELIEVLRKGNARYVKPRVNIRELENVLNSIRSIMERSSSRDVLKLLDRLDNHVRKLVHDYGNNIREFTLDVEKALGIYVKSATYGKTVDEVINENMMFLSKLRELTRRE